MLLEKLKLQKVGKSLREQWIIRQKGLASSDVQLL